MEYDNCLTNALAHIAAAAECLRKAEKLQSEMDPIRGPGSREWEILGEMLENFEGDLRMAIDNPGSLEAREDGTDMVDAEALYSEHAEDMPRKK